MTTSPHSGSELLEPGRLAALIDGVFAISLTLLILDLKLPSESGDLARALTEMVPRFLIYLFSFITIANQWMFHHRLFRFVRRVDSRLILLSFAYLLFITLVPVSAAIVGGRATDPLAAACFSVNLLLLCIAAWAGWSYIGTSRGLLAEEADPVAFRKTARVWVYIAIGFAVALALGFLSVYAAYAIWFIWPFTAVWLR